MMNLKITIALLASTLVIANMWTFDRAPNPQANFSSCIKACNKKLVSGVINENEVEACVAKCPRP
jgi:hypothetical protein